MNVRCSLRIVLFRVCVFVLMLCWPSVLLAGTVTTWSELSVDGNWTGSYWNMAGSISHTSIENIGDSDSDFPTSGLAAPITVSTTASGPGESASSAGTVPFSVPDTLTSSSADASVSYGAGASSFTNLWGRIQSDADQTVTVTLDYLWNSDTPTGFGYLGVAFWNPGWVDLLLTSQNGFLPYTINDANGDPFMIILLKEISGITSGTDTVSWTLPVTADNSYGYYTHVSADPTEAGLSPGWPAVPEPGTVLLTSTGLIALVGLRRRSR